MIEEEKNLERMGGEKEEASIKGMGRTSNG